MVKKGDWVKQYSAGYWQVVDVKKCFWEEDYNEFKKGEPRGEMVLLKQGFTNLFKFKCEGDLCHSEWCKPLKERKIKKIDKYFERHPEDLNLFDSYQIPPQLTLNNIWIVLNEEQARSLVIELNQFKFKFTMDEFRELMKEIGLDKNITTILKDYDRLYLLNLVNVDYEMDEQNQMLYKFSELIKHSDMNQ